jgi:hypothetical protein
MLLKYNFISSDIFYKNINEDGLILHPILEKYILDNILKLDKLKNNIIIFTNTIDIITSINHKERIPIYYNYNFNLDNQDNLDNLIETLKHIQNKGINNKYTPNNKSIPIYKSALSFEQNNMNISSQIRHKVISLITEANSTHKPKPNNNQIKRILLGIGGEYYVYQVMLYKLGLGEGLGEGLGLDYCQILGFTNNEFIHYDAEYNYKLHNMKEISRSYLLKSYLHFLIDYQQELDFNLEEIISDITKKNVVIDIIVNLSKLNVNVLQFIVRLKKNINSITIISCNERDFNTKIQLMPSEFTNNMISTDFIDEKMGQKVSVHHTKFDNYFN